MPFARFVRGDLAFELIKQVVRIEQASIEATHVAHMEPARSIDQGFDTIQQLAQLPASTVHIGKDHTKADKDEQQS
jgi:hypothetical protein